MHRALALKLFEEGYVGLSAAAKIAGVSSEEFLDLLAQSGIDAVRHPAEDLAKEAEAAS